MKKILFVCTGNTCRSPMAEGIFNDYAQKNNIDAMAKSAGIFVSEGAVSENAVEALSSMGIDISTHIPMQFEDYMIAEYDVILTMTERHKEYLISNGVTSTKVFTFAEYVGERGDVLDPYGCGLDVYKKTAEELKFLVSKYADKKND